MKSLQKGNLKYNHHSTIQLRLQ